MGASTVRFGQVGLGRIGAFHAESLAWRIRQAELIHVVDADSALASKVADRLNVGASTRYEDLLENPNIDAVLIATPTELHPAMIEAAAAAGKHIYCEKPLAVQESRARDAIAAVQRAGVKMQLGFHRRFDPDFSYVKQKIDDGTLGDVYLFRATSRDMRAPSIEYLRTCGGIFIDGTLHDFDVARWLVGDVVEVYASGAVLSDPAIAEVAHDVDNIVVTLRFASGALGVIDNSRVAGYGYETSIEVMGSRSTMRVGPAAQRVTRVETLSGCEYKSDIGTDFVARFADAYIASVTAFVRAVAEDVEPTPTGADAIAAFRLAVAAGESMRTNQPVRLQVV